MEQQTRIAHNSGETYFVDYKSAETRDKQQKIPPIKHEGRMAITTPEKAEHIEHSNLHSILLATQERRHKSGPNTIRIYITRKNGTLKTFQSKSEELHC